MKIRIKHLLLTTVTLGFSGVASGFVISPQPYSQKSTTTATTTPSTLSSTSTGDDTSSQSSNNNADGAESSEWIANLQSKEVDEVRQELIQRYITLGKSQEYAEKEVEEFLSDPERSEQFLEMRRYSKAQADELGFESVFQIGGAFILGLIGQVGFKLFSASQHVNMDGGM
eukprot:CAMPEP_0184855122 /NCGR_PEP_ID=MMETSP0580-20130426/441_1 /TAXON_ID=1118495 /ORGANISM="Dactyliosolen fragilissimus" /LENGTH=170 /DNA_ID=CAMNT_0027349551 /DNA_START=75 /DNA_END=587 /DNA_ORIENTATION=+